MLAKPLVSDRDKLATERRAFPSEVSWSLFQSTTPHDRLEND